ncbi:heme-binding protein [Haloarchaeobius litoreus]|uniref:Heme-binding protein n=1 Tax=Haloarchaeobius litoreus TaxID=755306 RepID=A0ABD6DLQ3_9EURY|nr:heme-binding protein [Haloarchaeobius litoreus]
MQRREPPVTEEGWYALHDFRTVDWDAWRDAPERTRERAVGEGIAFLDTHSDPETGGTAVYSILGHKADLMVLHLRPTLDELDQLERGFESTEYAGFTEQTGSYVSVTEASGYTERAREYFEGEVDDDSGLAQYIQSRLHPDIPAMDYVSFYPMSKRRTGEDNWYDMPFDERAEHMASHGDIGRGYGGKVQQMITGSVGLDDHEWGVTLWADDMTDVKELLYEMRFDPSTSRFAEFGQFYTGRRFEPSDLPAFMAGEAVPAEEGGHHHGEAGHDHGDAHGEGGNHHGEGDASPHDDEAERPATDHGADVRSALEEDGVYGGQPHGEDVYAVVLYSDADPDELFDEVAGLRSNFEHYDSHVKTAVYQSEGDAPAAVASVWQTQSAADTASGFLSDLPGIVRQAGDDADADTWGTMGMFYTTKPEKRADFVEKFDTVGEVLGDMEGHITTDLLANREDENDMFIASRWESQDDAMAFFRSDAFSDTVDWGRDVLADRPRHVFLA